MRKIKIFEILIGIGWSLISIVAGIALGFGALSLLPLNEFRPLVVVAVALLGFVMTNLVAIRIFVELYPIPVGDILPGSISERNYNIYLFLRFWVLVPLNRCGFIPVPMTGLLYRLLGAQLGPDTFTAGTIFDPQFVTIGSGTLLGYESLLVPHVLEGPRCAHFPIRIGNQVTIGAYSIIMADVEIGARAVVAMNSVVIKGTRIADDEFWGGTPARLIKRAKRESKQILNPAVR